VTHPASGFANPVFDNTSNVGTFANNGTVYPLNLGTISQGSGAFVFDLGVLNDGRAGRRLLWQGPDRHRWPRRCGGVGQLWRVGQRGADTE
jgi:hypothetical protein